MNNFELNRILKKGSVPEPPPEFWDQLPRKISTRLCWDKTRAQSGHDQDDAAAGASLLFPAARSNLKLRLAFALGLAVLLLVVAMLHHTANHGSTNFPDTLAANRIYFNELESLFPNQIRAIVFDRQGPHLLLADKPVVPASPPLFLRICGPGGCQSFITFSGQEIQVAGQTLSVLRDGQGKTILMGDHFLWSDNDRIYPDGHWEVEAKSLDLEAKG